MHVHNPKGGGKEHGVGLRCGKSTSSVEVLWGRPASTKGLVSWKEDACGGGASTVPDLQVRVFGCLESSLPNIVAGGTLALDQCSDEQLCCALHAASHRQTIPCAPIAVGWGTFMTCLQHPDTDHMTMLFELDAHSTEPTKSQIQIVPGKSDMNFNDIRKVGQQSIYAAWLQDARTLLCTPYDNLSTLTCPPRIPENANSLSRELTNCNWTEPLSTKKHLPETGHDVVTVKASLTLRTWPGAKTAELIDNEHLCACWKHESPIDICCSFMLYKHAHRHMDVAFCAWFQCLTSATWWYLNKAPGYPVWLEVEETSNDEQKQPGINKHTASETIWRDRCQEDCRPPFQQP